ISAGELNVDGEKFIAVSQAAPIGRAFLNAKVGDELSFNGNKYLVKEIL
ncbi:MAG: 3-oxoacyl-ACP synthase, partial [Flavobacterium sp.]